MNYVTYMEVLLPQARLKWSQGFCHLMVSVSKNSLHFLVWIPGIGILWVTDASHARSSSFGIVFHSFELIRVRFIAVATFPAVQCPQI